MTDFARLIDAFAQHQLDYVLVGGDERMLTNGLNFTLVCEVARWTSWDGRKTSSISRRCASCGRRESAAVRWIGRGGRLGRLLVFGLPDDLERAPAGTLAEVAVASAVEFET